jgi:RNA polymerase sigma-70 factor (ECF subfamily)
LGLPFGAADCSLLHSPPVVSASGDFVIRNPNGSAMLRPAMSARAESKLIERCRRGEHAAWDEVFELHYAPVGRYIFQLTSDFTREDVEEICQETFLAFIRHINSFQGGCQLQTWLFRIASNKSRDYREKRNAAKRGGGRQSISLHDEDPETGRTIDPPSPVAGPAVNLLLNENAALVGRALDELGEACQAVIQLRYFGDLSYKEISDALNVNEKTVSSRLSKCRDKLEVVVKRLFTQDSNPVFPSNP